MKKHHLCFIFLIFSIASLCAEVFRVGAVHTIEMNPTEQSEQVLSGLNDAIVIYVPENRIFIQAVDIEIKIPQEISDFFDSIAYSLYTDLEPVPAPDVIDYSGSRQHIDILPPKLSMTLRIPAEEESPKTSPYETLLPLSIKKTQNYIFLRFQQVMKGLPDNIMNAKLSLSAKPVLKDMGILELQLISPQDTQIGTEGAHTIYIDDIPQEIGSEGLLMETGMHHLSLVSDSYRNEVRTFTIEQARTTSLQIPLRDIISTIQIVAPAATSVWLDGQEWTVKETPETIAEGEHSIRFIVGDYETEKTFKVVNGRSYTLSLAVDIEIEENP